MIPDKIDDCGLLQKFQAVVHDIDVDEEELLSFLIARNYDIKQAEKMIRQSWAWRQTHSFDDAWQWDTYDELNKGFPIHVDGFDKNGQMAVFIPMGKWKTRQMITEGWKEEMERHLLHGISKLHKFRKDSGHKQFVGVVDLAELTYWKVAHYETVQMVLQMIRNFELNFPDKLSQAFVINAPWALNCILPAIQPFVPSKTMDKVKIFDSDHSKYLPLILDLIPEATMPTGLLEVVKNIK